MIVCRTPLRISFFGGGTDFPEFYEKERGAVFSSCIDKYITIKAREEDVRKESGLYFLNWKVLCEIEGGSGLGNSGALAVSYINILRQGQGNKIHLASDAYYFESRVMKNLAGKQDHLAASLGGLNKITFSPDRVKNYRYDCKQLFKHLILFYLPGQRPNGSIKSHIENIEKNRGILRAMRDQVDEAAAILDKEDYGGFAMLLHRAWELKKRLSDYVTNGDIDALYSRALMAGAIGGKVCGSGGGGHLLLMVDDPGKKDNVRKELRELWEIPIRFERQGSMVYSYGT